MKQSWEGWRIGDRVYLVDYPNQKGRLARGTDDEVACVVWDEDETGIAVLTLWDWLRPVSYAGHRIAVRQHPRLSGKRGRVEHGPVIEGPDGNLEAWATVAFEEGFRLRMKVGEVDLYDEDAVIRPVMRVLLAIAIAAAARSEAISLAVRMSAASSRVMADWCRAVSPPIDDLAAASRGPCGE